MKGEFLDLYHEDASFSHIKIKRGLSIPEGLFVKLVHVWIYNENNEFLIQKRAPYLDWFPNLWATTTGYVISGHKNYLEEAYRELKEELGLSKKQVVLNYEKTIPIHQYLCLVYMGKMKKQDIYLIKKNNEVSDVKWMSKTEIRTKIEQKEFATYPSELTNFVLNQVAN